MNWKRTAITRDGEFQTIVGCLDLVIKEIQLHTVERRRLGEADAPGMLFNIFSTSI